MKLMKKVTKRMKVFKMNYKYKFTHYILGVTPLLSFVYTGVIYYEEKDADWIATLFVVKDLESHLKVMILD